MRTTLIILLLASMTVLSQSPYKETYDKSFFRGQYPQKTPFMMRPYAEYMGNDSFRVYFPIRIAYSLAQFVFQNPGYHAEAEIGITMTNKKTNDIQSKVWKTSFSAERFRETHSRTTTHFTIDSMDVAPGAYDIVMEYRDQNGSQRLMFNRRLTLEAVEGAYYARP